tara:strand:+ start:75 stop:281 length:207 start_codon:yes stop_codon:yes gene_type:complete
MQRITKLSKIVYNTFIPPKPILGRWGIEKKNFIKTDLANHDSCGDELCGDPKITSIYISENLIKDKKK